MVESQEWYIKFRVHLEDITTELKLQRIADCQNANHFLVLYEWADNGLYYVMQIQQSQPQNVSHPS